MYSLENCFAGKLLCYFISLQNFPGFTLPLYFPANDRKPTDRLSFSTEIQWKKLARAGFEPSTF
jgi:hypothetical protein